MKEFLELIVKNLVDNPSDIRITEISGIRSIVCELKVGKGDIGKVIGKHGQTARALRILLSAVSAKQGKHASLEILE